MNYIRYYRLKSILNITKNNNVFQNKYEQIIKVSFLDKVKTPPAYNRESKMYFGGDGMCFLFELEITKVKLWLSKRLLPVSDFLRATYYRYDWTKLLIDKEGKCIKVLNKDLIQNNWEKMKIGLAKNYRGEVVAKYFEKLDKQMYTKSSLFSAISQYLYFGLLFPNIPIRHSQNWLGTRKIGLSEDEEQFEENIIFDSYIDNINYYNIIGKTLQDSEIVLSKFEGKLARKLEELFPEGAKVEIEFNCSAVVTSWEFELERIIP